MQDCGKRLMRSAFIPTVTCLLRRLFSILCVALLGACTRQDISSYEVPKEHWTPSEAGTQRTALPPGHPEIDANAAAISWTVPPGWRDRGPDPIRRGNFVLERNGRHVGHVVVVAFPDGSVPVEEYIHLLADQLELKTTTGETVRPTAVYQTLGDNEFVLFDLTGEQTEAVSPRSTKGNSSSERQAALAAILQTAGRTWFFNMVGEAAIVTSERTNFRTFLASVFFEERALPTDMAAQSLPPNTTSDDPNPTWTVPKGWSPGRPSPIRRASFAVGREDGQTADISVTTFPGDVGGSLNNINRWRRQLGLGPVARTDIDGLISEIELNGKICHLVDLKATSPPPGAAHPQRSLVATMMHNGNSWFFKITGDVDLVESQREIYLEFLQTIRF